MANQAIPILQPERNPVILKVNGKSVVSSVEVARHFGKRHDNVMRDILNLIETDSKVTFLNFEECNQLNDSLPPLNFESSTYRDGKGVERACYLMDRDAFTMLAMGFTGMKGHIWRRKYIAAFNAMEAELLHWRDVNHRLELYEAKDYQFALGYLSQIKPERSRLIALTFMLRAQKMTQYKIALLLGVTIHVISHIVRRHSKYLGETPGIVLRKLAPLFPRSAKEILPEVAI